MQGRRNKKLFWVPAIAPLISVILSTLIVYLTKADTHGVKIVKHFKGGLNPISAHQLQLRGPHVGQAAKTGLVIAIVALTVCLFYFFSPSTLFTSSSRAVLLTQMCPESFDAH